MIRMGHIACKLLLAPGSPLKGSFKGDIDIGIDVDEDMDIGMDI